MKEQREHQSFNVGLKAFIAQGEKLLILQDQDGLWELPGGRIYVFCLSEFFARTKAESQDFHPSIKTSGG